MKRKRKCVHNPQRARVHMVYTIDDVAKVFSVDPRTVYTWLKEGLPEAGGGLPRLIKGSDLRVFMEERMRARKRPCEPGEFFCLICKRAALPAAGSVSYEARSASRGAMRSHCAACGREQYQACGAQKFGWYADQFPLMIKRPEQHKVGSVESIADVRNRRDSRKSDDSGARGQMELPW